MRRIDDLLEERLEARGYQVTPPRRAILKAIAGRQGHFTVEEICRQARGVGRATVFRTMRLLVELEMVCRVLLESGNLHYRLSHREHHHHLICIGCGNVRDFSNGSLEDVVKDLVEPENFQIAGHWLEVYGRCGDCHTAGV
jgi:Fur family ferric uptake transcriptional regulator